MERRPSGGAHERAPVRALILAAGLSRRFGGRKLHALYQGRPLLSHALDIVGIGKVRGLLQGGHVVIAADDPGLSTLVRASGLDAIVNGAPELGLAHSVRLGLAALELLPDRDAGAVLIFLGDQPLVRPEVVEALVGAWRAGKGPIIRPCYQAQPEAPGHPALLARSTWIHARHLKGDRGFATLLDSAGLETVTLDVSGDNPDVDTRADLSALEEFSR